MVGKKLKPKIVVIGGGTGTYTVLFGLKKYPVELTAVVSMADEGGSNKVIRDEFGLLPTSDIRRCFTALADGSGEAGELMRNLFMYRFALGNRVEGMTFGNLFMAALSDILGSQKEAIEKTHKILKIKGRVLPVTFGNARLAATYEDGQKVVGEHFIDEPEEKRGVLRIKKIALEPSVKANPEAVRSILNSDLVVIGPGDLYTSIIPNLLVKGIPEALQKTRARVVYVTNLMTKFGQTNDFTANDHIKTLVVYLKKNILDYVIVNTKRVPEKVVSKYKNEKAFPVLDDLKGGSFVIVRGDVIGREQLSKAASDFLKRSFIRHDSDKLAKVLVSLL